MNLEFRPDQKKVGGIGVHAIEVLAPDRPIRLALSE
jgi:hypothetical protein